MVVDGCIWQQKTTAREEVTIAINMCTTTRRLKGIAFT